MEQVFVDVDEAVPCRVCQSLEGTLNVLTDRLEEDGVVLHEALEFVICLKVDVDDETSKFMCESCCERLQDAFRFKNLALESCKTLYELSSSIKAKEEPALDEDDVQTQTSDEGDSSSLKKKRAEIDMSTDAVAFFIEQHILKNKKKNPTTPPPPTVPSEIDWVVESIRQNPRTKCGSYDCTVCDKKFVKKSNLVDHLRLHANVRKFACNYCDKSFVQIANYRMHLRIHTKERPFQCPICAKSYNQSSTLKVHIRSHTQERNYVCPQCHKAFTNSSDLGKHKKVHDPSQQFKCGYCEKSFAQKVNMRKHQAKYHPDVIEVD